MRKTILLLTVALMCSYVCVAAPSYTASMTITITHDQMENDDELKLYEMPTLTLSMMNMLSSSKNMNGGLPWNLNVYAVNDSVLTGRQSILVSNNLTNQYLGVAANMIATNYQFKFTSVTKNRTLYLFDFVEGEKTEIVENMTYSFTLAVEDTVENRFMIGEEWPVCTYERAVANGNWATICFPYKWHLMEGVASLYKLTAINSAGTKVALDQVELANVKAGQPYIFQSNGAGQVFTYIPAKVAQAPDTVGSHGLNGVFADSTLTEEKWVITNNAVTPAASGSFVGQYRCFIDLGQTPVDDDAFTQQVPGRRIFNVKNTPTGVEMLEEVPAMQNGKMMIDGKLVIMKDGKMFNAQGAQL